jgi:prepilin-type N-terminal cleavage/methylation domain-containing protein
MSNTFTKNSSRVRGFTLIELLVVIAIIGLLSTIIAAPIQSARKKARDAKKISELKSVELALEQYAESNSAQYPKNPFSLSGGLSPQFMPLLPTFAGSTTSNARDAFAYVYYEASATGAASTTFAYHLGVKLEVYGPALETDRDCEFATLSSVLATPFCAVYNGNVMYSTVIQNGTQMTSTTTAQVSTPPSVVYVGSTDMNLLVNTIPISGNSIFSEQSSSTCVLINDCIFEVTSQQ